MRFFVAGTITLGALIFAHAAMADAIDTARVNGLVWLIKNQHGDGSFYGSKGLQVQATAGAVEGMLNGGMTKSPQYARALAWLGNAPAGSLDAQAWQTMTLALAGRDASRQGGVIRDNRNTSASLAGVTTGGLAMWGSYPGYGSGLSDTAMGYGALRSSGTTYSNDTVDLTVTALCAILPTQLTASPWSGAWPQMLQESGQPAANAAGSLPATALMLYELKKQRVANRFLSGSACGRSSPSAIDTAMSNAETWLIQQANGDGGFAERSPQSGSLEASNPSATVLAIRALSLFTDSAAVTAVTNARTYLVAQQQADGSWQEDPFVTARVLAALPAATGTQLTDSDLDGLPDVVEQRLGTQVLVADAQTQVNNNADSTAGVNEASFIASGVVSQAFSFNLSSVMGGGMTYALTGGVLPAGLSMNASGAITGIPTTQGSYAFDFQATDASGISSLVIGRIDIASADADVPIPPWALLALGGGLIAAMGRRLRQGNLA